MVLFGILLDDQKLIFAICKRRKKLATKLFLMFAATMLVTFLQLKCKPFQMSSLPSLSRCDQYDENFYSKRNRQTFWRVNLKLSAIKKSAIKKIITIAVVVVVASVVAHAKTHHGLSCHSNEQRKVREGRNKWHKLELLSISTNGVIFNANSSVAFPFSYLNVSSDVLEGVCLFR